MTINAEIYDARVCELGEGPLWHPLQHRLYWFDILGKRLLSRDGDQALEWQFDHHHSAAGWLDDRHLLLASETGLWRFDTETGATETVCPLEPEDPGTRSNDGRADPFGGFWIGTMGKSAEKDRGAIYRYYKDNCRKLFGRITIPNSICFAPDGRCAYFTDTAVGKILQQPLDDQGWPKGDPTLFRDLKRDGLNPDGSVIDSEGGLWNAQWGQGRVMRYHPDGREDFAVAVAGRHASCPAFGGAGLNRLFITTACEGIDAPDRHQGLVYSVDLDCHGVAEHRVIL